MILLPKLQVEQELDLVRPGAGEDEGHVFLVHFPEREEELFRRHPGDDALQVLRSQELFFALGPPDREDLIQLLGWSYEEGGPQGGRPAIGRRHSMLRRGNRLVRQAEPREE
jgi:hypothetical protein